MNHTDLGEEPQVTVDFLRRCVGDAPVMQPVSSGPPVALSEVRSTGPPGTGLPLTSAAHRLFLYPNDPEVARSLSPPLHLTAAPVVDRCSCRCF
jgi:hypothetical protein